MTDKPPVNVENEIDQFLESLKSKILESIEESTKDDIKDSDFGANLSTPNDAQLALINQHIGWESKAEDWVTINYLASNNLVDLGYRRWHLNILYQMALGFAGRPFIFDHDWYDSDQAISFIYNTALVRDSDTDEETLNLGNFGEFNRQIVDEEGYVWLMLSVAIARDSEVAKGILERKYNDCSTGSILNNPVYICPNCTRDEGREVGFYEYEEDEKGNKRYKCPHLIPSRWMFYYFGDDDGVQFADYAILNAEYHEPIELSSCTRGALPAASVIRESL